MGLGTVLMLVNVALIWLYTLSCHSCRHIMGGRLRHFSKHPIRYKLWTWVSKLNATTRATPGSRCSRSRSSTSTSGAWPPAAFDDPRFF